MHLKQRSLTALGARPYHACTFRSPNSAPILADALVSDQQLRVHIFAVEDDKLAKARNALAALGHKRMEVDWRCHASHGRKLARVACEREHILCRAVVASSARRRVGAPSLVRMKCPSATRHTRQ